MIFDFFLEMPIFILACFLFLYIPGNLLLTKIKIKAREIENVVLSLTLGAVLFTLVAYFLGLIHLRWAVPLILLGAFILSVRNKSINSLSTSFLSFKLRPHLALVSIITFGTVVFTIMVFGSGWETKNGMQFVGTNSRDGLWHLALTNSLVNRFPPEHPFLAGVPLKGYHYFFNFLLSEFIRLTPISTPNLLFRFFPILISILWGLSIYIFVRDWINKRTALWATFLSYIGGSFAYLLFFFRRKNFSLDDTFGILQPATSLINPPFAISVVILMVGFWAVFNFLKTDDKKWIIPIILLFGSLVGFKVYAGMIGIGALTVTFFWKAIREKRFDPIAILIPTFLLSAIVYFPNVGSSGFLSFLFLAPIQQVMAGSVKWEIWELQRLEALNKNNWPRFLTLETIGLVIFVIGNLGTRVLGFSKLITLCQNVRKNDYFSLFFLTATGISILIPLFFLQPINAYDIIQMGWYFLLFFAVLASWTWTGLLERVKLKMIKIILVIVLLILTFPSALDKVIAYSKGTVNVHPQISGQTLEAVRFISRTQGKNKIILELPQVLKTNQDPAMIKANIAFSQVVSLTGLKGYFGEEVQGYNFPQTEEKLEIILQILDPLIKKCEEPSFFIESDCRQIARNALAALGKTNIDLIYSEFKIPWFKTAEEISEIYSKEGIIIYEMKRK